MLYAYSVLDFYLNSLGMAVANRMAENDAVLMMPDGGDGDSAIDDSALTGQPLYAMEVANPGSAWYTGNDYKHRDVTLEEIFHMVHDTGIGTTYNPQAAPTVSRTIADATKNALPTDEKDWKTSGLWGFDSADWLKELNQKDSIEQEYMASVIDSYYGMWDAYPEGDRGMWRIYVAKTRSDIKAKDPVGYAAITAFLPADYTVFFRVGPTFDGTFEMLPRAPYGAKSRYLTSVALTGDRGTGLVGNDRDNVLMGQLR
ncbi:hypothetical protein OS123_09685 [Corynebacterium sp. P5875]|uniref:Uncharacterized protein n=1 Tax=Corynebacterium antarcticum TaxID=2800405 RepID=A0A9Q4CDD2_9CORY|nr:hypothetical protein [Corynebacterium antarcticum]MCX7538801.1 hypothetical protein [Corynebacterium antarcticum]